MTYPLVGDLAADGIPVSRSCVTLGFTEQAYYKWRARPYSDQDWNDAHLLNAIIDIHRDDPAFGYRFIADQLEQRGWRASESWVQRLCQENQIWSVFAKKKGRRPKAGPPVHDDLLQRDFTAEGPNQSWVGDITEHPTREGKLYLCMFKDLWSNRIVGYSFSNRMTANLAVVAIRNAAILRDCPGATVHTDRGSQFRSNVFLSELTRHNLVGSMGRVGACGDNASAESFFALLQKNVLDRQHWDTRDQLQLACTRWIETTYHRRRRQRSLGKLTPIEYETINKPTP